MNCLPNRRCLSQQRQQAQRGFTLIELLIALSISSVISVIAYQTVSSVVQVQTRTEAHTEQMETLQRAMWWMEQDFIQLAPRSIQDGLGSVLPAFQYREDLGVELTRIAEFPTPYGSGGLIRVAYQLEDETLYRLVWPVVDRAPDTQPTRTPILTGVERFEIRLMNMQDQFVNIWPNESQALSALPKLTEVRLQLAEMGEITRLFMGAEMEVLPVVTESAADSNSDSDVTSDTATESGTESNTLLPNESDL
ncbi:MAG: type II secretion system minor pseudopilin GspJ [Thiotrichales bacterium]|nr:type II secretion system minor pseudopilin GspJ [Thiotrichales bacterium]